MFVIVGIISLTLLFLLLLLEWIQKKEEKGATGNIVARIPPSFPIIGHFNYLKPSNMLNSFAFIFKEYGPNVDLFLFGKRYRIIGNIETAKEIMTKRPKIFRRPKSFEPPFIAMGMPNNVFAAEGAMWGHIRRIISPQFSLQSVHGMISIIAEESRVLVNGINSDGKSVVNGDLLFSMYTTRVISRTALGVELSEMEEYFGTSKFAEDALVRSEFRLQRTLYPFPGWTWKYSPLYKYEKVAREHNIRFHNECNKYVMRIRDIYEKRKNHPQYMDMKLSLTEILIREAEKHNKERTANRSTVSNNNNSTDSSGTIPTFTDADILDNIKLLFIAGTETTATILCWVVYLLCAHPYWQERVHAEVDEVLLGADGITSNEEVANCFIITAVMKEALRLYTPAPVVGLQLTDSKPYTCACNGMVIQPSDTIFINIDGCLRNNIYEHPDEFNPNRWLTSTRAQIQRMDEDFMTFGYGPRICPGLGLAKSEIIIATANIFHVYRVELGCPIEEIQRVLRFQARPNKIPLIFSKRS